SYIQYQLWPQLEASLVRVEDVESRVRTLLGEPLQDHPCYHICSVHPNPMRRLEPPISKDHSQAREMVKAADDFVKGGLIVNKTMEKRGREIFGLPEKP